MIGIANAGSSMMFDKNGIFIRKVLKKIAMRIAFSLDNISFTRRGKIGFESSAVN